MSRTEPYSRTIPHPLFERLIVEDAMNKEDESWKPERPHEYGYFPGCVDFMDVEVKFTHLNKEMQIMPQLHQHQLKLIDILHV